MKRRTFALILACALSLSLLSACGGGGGSSSSQGGSSAGGSSSVGDSSSASGSGSDQSAGGSASLPDESGSASTSEGGSTSSGSASQGGSSGTAEGGSSQADQLTLNRTDFTLFSAGSTFQLKYQAPAGAQGEAAFASSDEAVATVAQDGTVTAVAPGSATITLTYGDLTASCTVRCRWEDAPADTGDSSTGGTGDISQGGTEEPTEPETPAAENVDLQSFFDTINTAYEMPFMMAVDSTGLDSFYAGLTGISTQQLVVYQCGMSPASAGDEFETTDFDEEEVVIYTFAKDDIQEVYTAEEMSGEVTSVRVSTTVDNGVGGNESDGDRFVADGTTYNYNKTMPNSKKLITENVNNNVVA